MQKIIKCLYIFIYLSIKKKAATSHYFSAKMYFCLVDSLIKMISHLDLYGISIQWCTWVILCHCISYYIGKVSIFYVLRSQSYEVFLNSMQME